MSFTSSAPAALELRNVIKSYGELTAVSGLSFSVAPGSVVALLGPNGAGKTTTIEMCEGFVTPTSGEIRVLGLDPHSERDQVRRRIGVMLQGGGAYPGIRTKEMLQLVASYFANPLDVDWLLGVVGLERLARTSFRRLSGGQQQRLSLACALVGRPELVFLDEPTAGMDAQSRRAVWELVKALQHDGVTVLLCTHLMDEAESLADRVLIIDRGQLVADGTPGELISSSVKQMVSLESAEPLPPGLLENALSKVGLSAGVEQLGALSYRVRATPSPQLLAAITAACASAGVLLTGLSVGHSSLEDVFLDITGSDLKR